MDTATAHSTSNVTNPTAASYVDAYVPPTSAGAQTAVPVVSQVADTVPTTQVKTETPQAAQKSEELEDQNIFFMLGVDDGTPEQRETFLDELQQVIWEDFLEFDVKLLITKDEQTELSNLLGQSANSELEKQEKIVVFLEKLIPDLEEIMLEKALELKEEMARERVKGLREFYKDNADALQKIDSSEQMMNVGKWYSAAVTLNSLK